MTTFSKMAAISSMANSKELYVKTVGQILRNVLPDNTALHLNSLSIKHFVT